MYGTDRDRSLATDFIRSVVADGGTRHIDALLLALQMRPDVIFFLTDADEPQLTAIELAQIRRRNESVGASINTIEFGAGSSTGDLKLSHATRSAKRWPARVCRCPRDCRCGRFWIWDF